MSLFLCVFATHAMHVGSAERMGIDYEEERKAREYMTGPVHGIHPLANGGGKGLELRLREVELKHDPSPPSVKARILF